MYIGLDYRCDDNDLCTIDKCSPHLSNNVTSGCIHTELNCDDHIACTIDYCDNGICKHNVTSCDDGIRYIR